MASAKQRAWRKKFASMYGGGRKKKSAPRKHAQGSKIRHRSHSSNMAKRRSSHRRSGGFRSKLGSVGNIFKTAAAGVGGATIAGLLINQIAPQFSPIARIGGAYLGGGLTGVVADVVLSGGLGSIFGGGNTNQGMDAI